VFFLGFTNVFFSVKINKEFMKILKKNITRFIFIIAIFASGFFLGARESQNNLISTNNHISQPQTNADMSVLWQTWDMVKKKYVEPVDDQTLIYGAAQGLVASLGDPYSGFMDPQESKQFLQDMQGSFEGIGAEIGLRNGTLTIISPLEGMPAQKAGLKPGDKIAQINDKLTIGMGLDQAVRLIRGPEGTSVDLIVLRNDQTHKITIVRDKIDILSVSGEIKNDTIAYIDINNFYQDTPKEFSIEMAKLLLARPKGIVLDLRNNPGGYLDVAVDIAGWLIEKNKIVAIEDFGEKKPVKKYFSPGPGQLKNYPITVLVNKGSASASEILAGALRDLRGVTIIGEKTFGKGSVQELSGLTDGSNLKISVAKWLTPNGYCIDQQGIEPDIKIVDSEKTPDVDEALQKAIEVVEQQAKTS